MLSRCGCITHIWVTLGGCIVSAFCGCDVAIRPVESKPASPSTTAASGQVRDIHFLDLDNELESLQRELATVDRSLSAEVAILRHQIATKADIAEVRTIIETELSKMHIRERLARIEDGTNDLEKRLNAIEEQFGILPRTRNAPWVDGPGERDGPKDN